MAASPDPKSFVLPSVAAERLRRMADEIIEQARECELVYVGPVKLLYKQAHKLRAERWKPKGKAVAQ